MAYYNAFRICGILRYYALREFNKTAPFFVIVIASVLVLIAVSYLLGGLNFAIILSKKKFGTDVRDFGSGNAGMTNMMRTFGKKAGLITLAGDAGKTFVSCILGYLLLGRLGCFIAGLFCMLGHMFPIKYKFKGGKGVACTAVVILMTDIGNPALYGIPVVFLITLACFLIIVLGTKYISLGSIMAVLIYPLIFNAFEGIQIDSIPAEDYEAALKDAVYNTYFSDYALYIIIAFIMMVMVVFMHRENIKRLWNRQESKFKFHSSKSKEADEENNETVASEVSENAESTENAESKPRKSYEGKPNPSTSKKKLKRRNK